MQNSDDLGKFAALIGAAAATGNIAVVPQTQSTPGDGSASIALGFPPETFIARASGGEPPRGADMNGFLNRISRAIQVLQAGYLGPFDATFAAGIGGYPSGAIVSGGTAGTFWVSTANNNVTVPGATGAQWQSLFNGLATQVALSAEVSRATAAETALSTSISSEASRAQSAESSLATSISNETSARTAAVSAEASTRASNDSALQNQINNIHASQSWNYVGASTSVTVPSWATIIEYEVLGGGGAGGACGYTAGGSIASYNVSGAGGGSAGLCIGTSTVSAGQTISCTIGAGGTSSSGIGGTTTLQIAGTTIATANGGGQASWTATGSSAGGIGGTASGGSLSIQGSDGSDGQSGEMLGFGNGGASRYGGAGRAGSGGGGNGHGWGAGGGGAYDRAGDGNIHQGGSGSPGLIRYRFIP